MQLKKVEIQGFKSFADKTEIEIKDGITAIVGPNGSGKSNISDAIRWVLGEQSVKNLRGSKMEDVIFAGTSKRKPLGYAEVTITFDNKSGLIPIDYGEIAVTRRMFRSGESEYYINKNSCRLKDIRELFMDTGIGKDGYSIIGQGRIEEILSNRPEDRRHIFEEAAGIVKYKSKKEEAERKLDKTESNLMRIKDLIFELSNQLEVLEIQAQKANYFTELYNKLKSLEINLSIKDIRKLNSQIDEINQEKLILEKELEQKLLDRELFENNFNSLKETIKELESNIEDYRNKNSNIMNQLDKDQNQVAIIEEKEKFYNKDLARLKEEKINLNNRLEELNIVNEKLIEEKLLAEKEYNKLLEIYNEKNIELEKEFENLQEKERNIELEKNNMIRIYNSSSEKKSELNGINSFNENIEKRILQLKKEIHIMDSDKNVNISNYNEVGEKEKNLQEQLLKLNERLQSVKEKERDISSILETINKSINTNNVEIQSKTSSYKLLKNMEEDYEGYYKGVKSLLKSAKREPKLKEGLIGVVAELIKVNEKFERAIDISLGSNIQNMVTETQEDAKRIIEYLKHNKLGRVTFLPLNVIKGNILDISIQDRKEFKIYGLGYELIDFNKKYENIFKFLLGRTIIIENIDCGIRLANKYNHSYRIVTLDGEILNPGGSMTGGSQGNSGTSIISRKGRIENLTKDIERLNKIQEKLNQESITYINSLKESKEEIVELDKSIKETEHSIINIVNQKEKYINEINRLKESMYKAEKEIDNLGVEVKDYKDKEIEILSLLEKLDKEITNKKEEIKNLTITYNEEKSIREEKLKNITDTKINLNLINSNISNLQEKWNKNKFEINSIKDSIKEKEEMITLNIENIEEITKSKISLNAKIKELNLIAQDTKEELEKLISNKTKFMEEFYSEQNKLNEINKVIGEVEKNINSNEVKLARITVQLENHHKKLKDDYDLCYEEALGQEVEIKNIQEAIVESRKLKVEIKELGTVNLSSIEEYKNLKERLDFILNQQKDLLSAKENLKEVIKDMENNMKTQFLMNFNKINDNFQEIFKNLFDGGQAELVLEEDENILDSGIEIKAQPPGKKLQSLTLLSGGEKSLTAVALLFAILTLKPSPFCILDEIDAALDEANISRYTSYLKTFYENTQFVLITHRKTTMEIADILYGVAMEEEGISKLISVKLKDNIDEIAS
ncbi:chromosome segregation protein SMC [Tissierella pigra]|uniref:Chromosome partition protein Smc n=1 Tax=Tissierella pigra TaxID=2607614 RepID=A0A6N7XDE0_9FIRM|nr:chromosome segregation protein SMC [Tissierella pigra]MBU5426505.1 chromosome segregation protein SMC [Tissierella pigra]MSU00049.1 chromosome segregation protein SMC [Tissierella pigra]